MIEFLNRLWLGVAQAQAQYDIGLPFDDRTSFSDFDDYFSTLVGFAVRIAGLIAVLVIVYAGIVYSQSQGQVDRIAFAKELVAGALTGLAILLLITLVVPTLGINVGVGGQ